MSNVINFSVEISPEKKDVALRTMALIAAMAEVSMLEMANVIDGIEVVDAEEVKMAPKYVDLSEEQAAALEEIKKKMQSSDEIPQIGKAKEEVEEKPKRRRKKKAKTEDKSDESEAEDTSDSKVEEPKKEKLPKKEREDSAVDKYEAEKAKEEKSDHKDEESDISIEDVRKLLKEVVQDNRDEIKAKLKELGGTSVSTLPEKNYGKMLKYLKSLK